MRPVLGDYDGRWQGGYRRSRTGCIAGGVRGLTELRAGWLLLAVAACLMCACDKGPDTQPVIVDINDLAEEWNSADKKWQVAELLLLDSGKKLYKSSCAGCHLSTGEGQLTIGAPALKGSAVVTGPPDSLIRIVVSGRNSMPAFGQGKSTTELTAILSYVRNAWGNAAGDIVTVSDREVPGPQS